MEEDGTVEEEQQHLPGQRQLPVEVAICSGASTAAITIPVRSVRAAAPSAGDLSRRQADSPAITNDAVRPEASSICARR